MADDLLSIGQFARLSGLSVGALRHYDELDLLRPAAVDPFTGYRRYRPEQVETAQVIGRLRELEMSLDEIRGKRVGDIGSGSGRIVNMLLAAGATEVVAVEPSDAMEVLRENTRKDEGRIRYVHATGEAIAEAASDLDFIVSYGVLHHITDPSPVVR